MNEKGRGLDDGKSGLPKPVSLDPVAERFFEAVPLGDLVGQDVFHPFDGAQGHGVPLPDALAVGKPQGRGSNSTKT